MSGKLVEVENLCKYFTLPGGQVLKAVDRVSFDIRRGEILGLVGESGCGKTTLGRCVKQLYPATSGTVRFDGQPVDREDRAAMKRFAQRAQMIFQDPFSSLDPRMTVAEIITEGMDIHGLYTRQERRLKAVELLETIGLNREHANRFPHEFSGGQRQRIGIARSLALNPEFIVCDEPISALDVSIQAQIVNLFRELGDRFSLTYLFIAHDLSMVKYISDRVAVMYLGRIVEISRSDALYRNPLHPYTEFLLSSIPIPNPRVEAGRAVAGAGGDIPSPVGLPEGCSFRPRCRYATKDCAQREPELREAGEGHYASCTRAAGRRAD